MTMEARVGVVVEGGQRALHTATAVNNTVVDAGNRKLLQQQQSNKPSLNQKQGGSISHLIAGGISGAFAKTCTAPLARLTILFQVKRCKLWRVYGVLSLKVEDFIYLYP